MRADVYALSNGLGRMRVRQVSWKPLLAFCLAICIVQPRVRSDEPTVAGPPPAPAPASVTSVDGKLAAPEFAETAPVTSVTDSAFPPISAIRWRRFRQETDQRPLGNLPIDQGLLNDADFSGTRLRNERLGSDFYSPPIFDSGIVIDGVDAALKIGGYVKADIIQDFNPIKAEDSFDTTKIEVGVPRYERSKMHARQTRFNFDTRWNSDYGIVRAFVETDFFGTNNQSRMRHAFGEIDKILAGHTWTTFTDIRTLPTTLDFEGPAGSVLRRQAQLRWTEEILVDGLTTAIAIENPSARVDLGSMELIGEVRNQTPDFVWRVRYSQEQFQYQVASLIRELGFQSDDGVIRSEIAWGLHFTGYQEFTEDDSFSFQILFGDGIGSYRSLPDAALIDPDNGVLLQTFAWTIGYTHEWRDDLSSSFTYSENTVGTTALEGPDALKGTTYLAVNLIWNPADRFFTGVEYLNGTRTNRNGQKAQANRLQFSLGFYLP